ncbi:MAG: NifU family protein [Synergistales bacterium]|nr:NifU family protein [Synergistales bacterium]
MINKQDIVNLIDEKVRPALQSHGGDIEFKSYDEQSGVVQVELTGACGSCPFARETLRGHVEAILISELPDVKAVVQG